jgi:uncharacterized protein (UPF0332 family)
MGQTKNLIKWCLKKGEEREKHKGLKRINPDKDLAKEHISKEKHYLAATIYLRDGNYSDISVSSIFYAMYHCLLAILAKHGYESRNQQCTFAVVDNLIDSKKISLDKEWLKKIATFDDTSRDDVITLREEFQYGTKTRVNEDKLNILVEDAKEFIDLISEII